MPTVSLRPILALLSCLCALAAPSRADTITGQVVDASGVGVPGVDIDVDNLGSGGDPDIFNDGTDANGFFTTTVPAGVYDIYFFPPTPPTSTHLPRILGSRVVVGTTDLGVIQLGAGVAVTGNLVDSLGIPVANVNLDVTNTTLGQPVLVKGAVSNAFGFFGVAVPPTAIEITFDTTTVLGRTLAPRLVTLSPTVNTSLGNLVLEDGWVLSGTVRRTNGTALANLDLDVFDHLTGERLYTPSDNTNALGFFDITLPTGNFDLEICPPAATRLVAREVESILLSANLDLGILTIESGFLLSGVVRSEAGVPLPAIDLDVTQNATGLSVLTCSDDTTAAGSYLVVVPAGTLDISFALPGAHGTTGADLHVGVAITGDTVLDGILPSPAPEFSASTTVGPAPLSVTFNDLSTGAITARSWDFGDGSTSTLASPSHVYASPGTYSVSLSASGPGGSGFELKPGYILAQPPAPTASFVGSPLVGVEPLSVSFGDLSTGVVTSWAWSFGDGGSSTSPNPIHVFLGSGSYSVSLEVTGPGGSDSLTRLDYVTVTDAPPVAGFSAAPTAGVAPLAVTFSDTSSGTITAFAWTFGDGGVSSLQNPAHTYTAAGTFTVGLTVSGPGGSDTLTLVDHVVVSGGGRPVANFVGTPTAGSAPLTVSFSDQSQGTVSSWAWSFGDGSAASVTNPTHVYTSPGTYTVVLLVNGSAGSDFEIKSGYVVVGNTPPVASFDVSKTRGLSPLTVSFSNGSTGASSYLWEFGDGSTSTEATPTHTYNSAGRYDVRLTATGSSGSDVLERVGLIRVRPGAEVASPVRADFDASPRVGVAPLLVDFQNLSGGMLQGLLWNFGDGASSTASSPRHVYTQPGIYTVTLSVIGAGGSDTRTRLAYIEVLPAPPVAGLTAAPRQGRAPLHVGFTDLSTGTVTSWAWDFGDGSSSTDASPQHTYTGAGSYTVTLVATGPAGTDTLVMSDFVVVRPTPARAGATISGASEATIRQAGEGGL